MNINFNSSKLYFSAQTSGIVSHGTTADTSHTPSPAPATSSTPSTAPTIYVGDLITLGSYYQTSSQVKEPISWLVLEKIGSRLLLISDKILDVKEFTQGRPWIQSRRLHSPWEFSSLRKWLNGRFLKIAFKGKERKCIEKTKLRNVFQQKHVFYTTDKVFLLCNEDVKKYFPDESKRVAAPTDYATEQERLAVEYAEAVTHKTQKSLFESRFWWLRTGNPDGYGYSESCSIECCDNHGIIFPRLAYRHGPFDYPFGSFLGVRPAMWIDLNKK